MAGILSEISFSSKGFEGIVLGIGVNLNLSNQDLENINIPATSLNLETNKKINSELFINSLCDNFYAGYDLLLKNGFSHFRAKYIHYCNFIGKEITIKNPDPIMLGIALNVCDCGKLEILKSNGEIEKIISGDVVV